MIQSKNVIWWTAINNPAHQEKYGGYEYFEYSKKTWQYWCKKNNVEFVEFTEPREKDLKRFNPNWQKCIFAFDELEDRNINYNKIALIDSTAMIKWDAPNFFDLTDDRFTAWRDMDNMKWVHDSIIGYKEFYDNFECDILKYFNSGFMIFNKSHKDIFNALKDHYYKNTDKYIDLQSNTVKKGNDQTPVNYWMQMNNVDINLDLPLAFNLTHLHRKEMLTYNWQLEHDKTPHFIKHGYVWRFNGIPKDQRTSLMSQTWQMVGAQYV